MNMKTQCPVCIPPDVPYIIIIKIIIRSIKVAGYYFLTSVCSTFSVDFSILPGEELPSSVKSAARLFLQL
jgi:hypothetical protein